MIIGLGHISGAGKDTAATAMLNYLMGRGIKAEVTHLASPLKKTAKTLFGHLGLRGEAFYETSENRHLKDQKLDCGLTPRDIWIRVGADMRAICEDVWLRQLEAAAMEVTIVPDVRNFNEFAYINNRGYTVRVDRGLSPENEIDSLLVDADFGYTIHNNGSINELVAEAVKVLKLILTREGQ